MQLYSCYPAARSRQIVADVVALTIVAIAAALGIAVGGAVAGLGAFGRQVAEAGAGLRSAMDDAAGVAEGVPIVGSALAGPFRDAGGVGSALVASGEEQQRMATALAVAVGLLVALGPLLVVLLLWLPRRLRFARRATATRRLGATASGRELLALRALVQAPPKVIAGIAGDPVASWRAGDPGTVGALADLELRRAGVRPGGAGSGAS
ncbi:MAG: hypothetical protein JWP66_1551 [Naasia sp.]|nr:hypothetical protein [Naasia sp.]